MADGNEPAAIETLLLNYAWGIDSKDWELFRDCFTEECDVSYGNGDSPHPGRRREVRQP